MIKKKYSSGFIYKYIYFFNKSDKNPYYGHAQK